MQLRAWQKKTVKILLLSVIILHSDQFTTQQNHTGKNNTEHLSLDIAEIHDDHDDGSYFSKHGHRFGGAWQMATDVLTSCPPSVTA